MAAASDALPHRVPWHARLGLGDHPADLRLLWGGVLAVLLIYTVSFAFLYPTAVTNDDEASYLRQARLALEGRSRIELVDALTGDSLPYIPSLYPVGTALLMAPFVAAFGWRGAYLVPLLGLIVGILLTAFWIREERGSPLFALLILGFPSALVLGRVAMSDVPSMAVVAFGLWLFFVFFLIQEFDTKASSLPKRLILTLRYLLPILPIIAFAMADASPRLWRRFLAALPPPGRLPALRMASAGIALWLVGLGVLSIGVNSAFHRWSHSQNQIRDAIRSHVGDDSVLVTNWWATRKFIELLDRRFLPVVLEKTPVDELNALAERHAEYFVVLLDRSDSDFWRRQAKESAGTVDALQPRPVLEVDLQMSSGERRRIWRVRAP